MNQFIIENPVLSIVIAFIIGAVIMNITSVLAVRMAVEKEVERALGDDEKDEETREIWDDFSLMPNRQMLCLLFTSVWTETVAVAYISRRPITTSKERDPFPN